MRKNILLSAIVIISSFVTTAYSEVKTYYEIWRSETQYSSQAARIKQWISAEDTLDSSIQYDPSTNSFTFIDKDSAVLSGQHYFYWIRALACKTVGGRTLVATDFTDSAVIDNAIRCPVASTDGYYSPIQLEALIYNPLPLLDCGYGPVSCEIEEYDFPSPDGTIDIPWYVNNVKVKCYASTGPEQWNHTWNKDIDVSSYWSLLGGDPLVYFQVHYDGFEAPSNDKTVESPIVEVNIRNYPDAGPTSQATHGIYADKIAVSWNAVTNICSEITADETLSPKCEGWVSQSQVVSSIVISGPDIVNENSGTQYTCTAYYTDGSTENITSNVSWVSTSAYGSVTDGYLTTSEVTSDQSCIIRASYQGFYDEYTIIIKNVTTPLPDLIITSLSPEPESADNIYYVGDDIEWNVVIKNNSSVSVESWSNVAYYLGNDKYDLSNKIDEDPVPYLTGYQEYPASEFYIFEPSDIGQKYLICKADYENSVDESNEGNNIRFYGPFTVIDRTGDLTVNLHPQEAVDAGAMWRIWRNGYDSGEQNSGQLLQDIPIGTYTLEFKDIPGFEEPNSFVIEITQGSKIEDRNYSDIYFGGSGVADDPFVISDVDEFMAMQDNPSASGLSGSYFALSNDIDLSDRVFRSSVIDVFGGKFDGGGHKIIGLSINAGNDDSVGMFGWVIPGGEISNLGIEKCLISGNNIVGGLVARLFENGTIKSCYVTGALIGNECVGGIAGDISGSVTNCYSSGYVKGNNSVGGVVGYNGEGVVLNCYSMADIDSIGCAGGLIGQTWGNTNSSNSFWNIEEQTHGVTVGIGCENGGITDNIAGLSTEEMLTQNTFMNAGWDFNDLDGDPADWKMRDGFGCPLLRWQEYLKGDFAGDYSVNLIDFSVFAASWMSQSGDTNWNSRCDISNPNDSIINTVDLAVFCENWLSGIDAPVEPPIDNIIAYWQMDEGSGSIISDSSGNEHTGTVYGASWTSGISSDALSFDGINDYVAISYDSDFAYTIGQDDLTLSALVYPRSKDSSESGAIYSDRAVGNDVVAVSMKVSSGMFNVGGWSPTSDGYTVQASVPANNKWYLMTAVFDSSEVKLYIDGTLKSSASLSGVSLANGGTGMMLGKHQGGSWSNYFDGIIDDVRIYNKALSSSEVAALCNPAELTVIYSEELNSNPGWIAEGQWEFGVPLGLGGTYGNPDPASGYTGSNVYGVNLAGNYSTSASQVGPYYLTAGPFDCSGYSGITLSFYRWLNQDEPMYTPASVEVSINGQDWYPVWQYNASIPTDKITDATWVPIEYDISQYADNQSTVYIRWGYTVYGSSGAYPESGWNIDDIRLLGEM